MIVRELGDADWEQRARMGSLAFGYPRPTEMPPPSEMRDASV